MIFSLLKLAEIQTKLASQLPLLLGTVYALWRYDDFNLLNLLFMFLSLLSFDMATTVTNNYMDYKKDMVMKSTMPWSEIRFLRLLLCYF